jgi:hypothetical protein
MINKEKKIFLFPKFRRLFKKVMNESFKNTIPKASYMIRVEAHGLLRLSLRILPGGVADAASSAHAYSPQSQELICSQHVKNLWRT